MGDTYDFEFPNSLVTLWGNTGEELLPRRHINMPDVLGRIPWADWTSEAGKMMMIMVLARCLGCDREVIQGISPRKIAILIDALRGRNNLIVDSIAEAVQNGTLASLSGMPQDPFRKVEAIVTTVANRQSQQDENLTGLYRSTAQEFAKHEGAIRAVSSEAANATAAATTAVKSTNDRQDSLESRTDAFATDVLNRLNRQSKLIEEQQEMISKQDKQIANLMRASYRYVHPMSAQPAPRTTAPEQPGPRAQYEEPTSAEEARIHNPVSHTVRSVAEDPDRWMEYADASNFQLTELIRELRTWVPSKKGDLQDGMEAVIGAIEVILHPERDAEDAVLALADSLQVLRCKARDGWKAAEAFKGELWREQNVAPRYAKAWRASSTAKVKSNYAARKEVSRGSKNEASKGGRSHQ